MLKVGDKAPDFTLTTAWPEGPKPFSLSSLRGRNVVLLFFPLVNSSGCRTELCGVRDDFDSYRRLGAEVVALSVDSPSAQKLWAELEKFPFTLVSDFNKEASRAWGALYEDYKGLKGVSKRSAFVLDKEGMVRHAWVSDDPAVQPDFQAIKHLLQQLP